MEYWRKLEQDAFLYYGKFSRKKALQMLGEVPNLSVYTLNSILMGKDSFIKKVANDLNNMFTNEGLFNEYKLYLIATKEIQDKTSRLEKYKKIWKSLQLQWKIDSFNKGAEVELSLGEKSFYCSIAEFNLDDITTALSIVTENPFNFTIISSKREAILSEYEIINIFSASFNDDDMNFFQIDYFSLSISLCLKEDIVFKFGDSSEEINIGLIFNTDLMKSLKILPYI